MKCGEIWLVALDPTVGIEIEKSRPCVIISPPELNEHLNKNSHFRMLCNASVIAFSLLGGTLLTFGADDLRSGSKSTPDLSDARESVAIGSSRLRLTADVWRNFMPMGPRLIGYPAALIYRLPQTSHCTPPNHSVAVTALSWLGLRRIICKFRFNACPRWTPKLLDTLALK